MCAGMVLLRQWGWGWVLSERVRLWDELYGHGSRGAGWRDWDCHGREGQWCWKSRCEELHGFWVHSFGGLSRFVKLVGTYVMDGF